MKRFGKIRKILLRALLVLLASGFAGWLFENWRGAKAWEEAKARAEAAGVSLVRADYAGPEIPDEENLLLNPVFAEEFEKEGEDRLREWASLPGVDGKGYRIQGPRPWNGTSADYRNYFKDELSEDEARDRLAEFASEFEERLDRLAEVILETPIHPIFEVEEVTGELFDGTKWIFPIQCFSRSFKDSALLAVRRGESDKGLQRVAVLFRLAEMTAGPSLVSVLVSNSIKSLGLSLIWEGIRLRCWTDTQLKEISTLCSEPNYHENLIRSLAFEAAFGREFLMSEDIPEFLGDQRRGISGWYDYGGPQGWRDQRKAFLVTFHLELIEILKERDFERLRKISETQADRGLSPLAAIKGELSIIPNCIPGACWMPKSNQRIARIALEAERLFLQEGKYPDRLQELSLPFPVIDLTDPEGRVLAYKPGPNGRPQIWSRYQEELGEEGDEKLRWQFWAEESR